MGFLSSVKDFITYDKDGYDKKGYDRYGYNRKGYNRKGYNRNGYNIGGYNKDGYHVCGYDKDGFNKNGYDESGFNRKGYDKDGDDKDGYDLLGYNEDGYDEDINHKDGYNENGNNKDGYDAHGFNEDGNHKDGYDSLGYDSLGYDWRGYDEDGYNRKGYNKKGYNKKGYNKKGYNKKGYNKKGYNKKGYDRKGYNKDGYDENGYDEDTFNFSYNEDNISDEFKEYDIKYLWHITHRKNVKSICEHGILSHHKAHHRFAIKDISNLEVNDVGAWKKDTIYNRILHKYVRLYINPYNPMLYVLKNLNEKLCLIKVSLSALAESDYLITDGNAVSRATEFYDSVDDLDELPWDVLDAEYWSDFEDGKRQRCAEVLVHRKISPDFIKGIYCYSNQTKHKLRHCGCKVKKSKKLFF